LQLGAAEKAEVVANYDHLNKLKFSKALPFAFTEFGAIQPASVLTSTLAVEMGIFFTRAFLRLKSSFPHCPEAEFELSQVLQTNAPLGAKYAAPATALFGWEYPRYVFHSLWINRRYRISPHIPISIQAAIKT
jgi:hypothetical protein